MKRVTHQPSEANLAAAGNRRESIAFKILLALTGASLLIADEISLR
jgi:hypothetical protein